MISPKIVMFEAEAKKHPGMSSFNLERFNTTFPSLLPVIEKSMESWSNSQNADTITQLEDMRKKNEVAIHNLDKLEALVAKDIDVPNEVYELIISTLSVIK